MSLYIICNFSYQFTLLKHQLRNKQLIELLKQKVNPRFLKDYALTSSTSSIDRVASTELASPSKKTYKNRQNKYDKYF